MRKNVARAKTNKAVAKRFKITGTGKVMRRKAGRRHLAGSKSRKRKRWLSKSAEVESGLKAHIFELLPFGK